MDTWRNPYVATPLAASGLALGIGSLLGPWATVVIDGATTPTWMLYDFNIYGLPYVGALVALLTMVAATIIRGSSIGRRVAGLAVAGLSLALVGCMGGTLANIPYTVGGTAHERSQTLGWGIYAAFGALITLGAALLASTPIHPAPQVIADEPTAE